MLGGDARASGPRAPSGADRDMRRGTTIAIAVLLVAIIGALTVQLLLART